MKEKGSIEIISFNQVETIGEKEVFNGFEVLAKFYKKCDGYHGMDIAKGKDSQWILVLKWQSKDHERKASSHMMKSEETNDFKIIVNPKTVVKNVYPMFY
ncbi:MAG: hypothetical protein KAQ68_03970 [Clostridiales bacterium]|nr:hypothetical protein [Clostridiales bacterium]